MGLTANTGAPTHTESRLLMPEPLGYDPNFLGLLIPLPTAETATITLNYVHFTEAWIETFFGHLKAEFPHLLKIKEPAVPSLIIFGFTGICQLHAARPRVLVVRAHLAYPG